MAKYPWGDDTFPMPVFMGLVFVLSPITGAILYMVGNDAAVTEDTAPGLIALEAQATAQKGKTESHKQSVRSTVWIGCE